MFYGGGLWGYFNQSCLDNLFSKSDFTIEQLLDEDNIINDVKMNQNKFADYMIKNPQYLQDMIKYAISMPSEEDDDKKKHNELLGIQIQKVQEFLFAQHESDDDQSQYSDVATDDVKSIDSRPVDEKNHNETNDEIKDESKSKDQESTNDSIEKKSESSENQSTDNAVSEQAGDKSSENKDEVKEGTDSIEQKDEIKQEGSDTQNQNDDAIEIEKTNADDTKSAAPKKIKGKDLLNMLFQFLETDEDLNSTSAGYFNKIVMHLISSREGYFWKYLKTNTKVIDNMLKHFYLKSVSKIVFFLIASDGIDLDPDTFIEQRVDMIQRLHQKFRESDDHEVLLNIQEILVQVNSTSLRPQSFEVKRQLFSLEHINILIESIEKHKESFSQASLVLSSYLDHYRQTMFNDNSNEDTENYCSDGLNFGRKNDEAISKEFPLEYIQSKTVCLIKALMEENFNIEVPKHETQYGSEVQPFGLNRVKLLHLILCLLKTENQSVNDAIVQNGFFKYLLNLITKHEWNNILHNQIEQIYNESFKIAMKNDKVRDAIIKDAKFLDFIVENGSNFKTSPGTSKKPITKGYVCMLVNFANQIEDQKTNLTWLEEAVKETQNWDTFVNGSLKDTNDLHKRDLGNEDPRKRKESEDSMPNNDLSIKEIYMKFISMYQNKTDDEPKNNNDDSDGDDSDNKDSSNASESPEIKSENTEEVGFDSINYWKFTLNHDVDQLMKEL